MSLVTTDKPHYERNSNDSPSLPLNSNSSDTSKDPTSFTKKPRMTMEDKDLNYFKNKAFKSEESMDSIINEQVQQSILPKAKKHIVIYHKIGKIDKKKLEEIN